MVNGSTAKCVLTDRSLCEEGGSDEEGAKAIVLQAFYCKPLDKIVVVTYDHNILFLNTDFSLQRQVWADVCVEAYLKYKSLSFTTVDHCDCDQNAAD